MPLTPMRVCLRFPFAGDLTFVPKERLVDLRSFFTNPKMDLTSENSRAENSRVFLFFSVFGFPFFFFRLSFCCCDSFFLSILCLE